MIWYNLGEYKNYIKTLFWRPYFRRLKKMGPIRRTW